MNVIERIKKDARSMVSAAEIFVSSYMSDLLGSKLRLICRSYRVATPTLSLMFDDKSEITARTSLESMQINSAHEMFDGDDETRLLKVSGTLLHETGHIIFTNYTASQQWVKNLSLGLYYPSAPEVDPEYEEAREKLLKLSSGIMRDAFLNLAHDLNNIVEDGRIENFIMKYIKNARFMMKGLVKVRQETYAEMEPFEDIQAKVSSGTPKILAMQSLILHYARFREVKGKFDPKSDLGKILVKLIPEIDKYLEATKAVDCYSALNKILVYLEEIIEEYFNKEIDKQQGLSDELKELLKQLSSGQNGQANGSDNKSQGQGQSSNQEKPSDSKDPSSGKSSQDQGKKQSQSSGAGDNSSSSKDVNGGSSPSQANQSGNDSSGDQSSSQSSGDRAKMEASASEIAKDLKDLLDKMAGKTVDQSANMGDQAKGSDRSSVGRRISKFTAGEGGEVNAPNTAEAAEGTGEITHAEADDVNLDLMLKDIARKISDEKSGEMISSEVRREYAGLAKDVKDYNEIHKNADITMYHYSNVSQSDIDQYNEIARACAPLVKRAVKSSNFYDKDQQPYTEDRLFCGTTLHAEQSYRKDGRIFSKTYDNDEPPKVAVAVRIDCSGSMSGSRLEAARRCCVFLYEYVLGMEKRYGVKIPLYIYGDRVMGGVNMYVFADDKFRTANEKYRLMKLQSGGRNRDGLPIRMAVKKLEEEHPSAQKVIFNITDGQPNDTNYGGVPAFNDLRDITKHCEKKRIALTSCAIGTDRRKIEEIYGSSHFLNISDLNELPVRLVKILKKLLK